MIDMNDAVNGMYYETIEEALYTKCHLCGTPLDWSVSLKYVEASERNFIYATANSCGITFSIEPQIDTSGAHDGYMLFHT